MDLKSIFSTSFKLARIGVKAGFNVTHGAINTVTDVANTTNALLKGDTDKACKIVGRRIENTVIGVCRSVESAAVVLDRAIVYASSDKKGEFLDKDTENHLVRIASIAAVGTVAGSLIGDGDIDSADLHDPVDGHDYGDGLITDANLSGIDNGVFVGDSSDLNNLIQAGQIDGTEHQDTGEYERDPAARDAFLSAHGYSSVPEGYEVHHIVPLCEGGADSPDNMVLIKEDEHEQITAAHARFYNWRNS